jgi:hypothetical protein
MIVRTSKAKEPSFNLGSGWMIESDRRPYFLRRSDLKRALTVKEVTHILVGVGEFSTDGLLTPYRITQGKTQRNKKFISIGCKRFVGEQRRKLIHWALDAK